MKLASFLIGGKPGYGLVTDNGVVDLSRRFPECATLRDFLAAGLQAKAAALSGEAADHALDAITFAPTIPNPDKIICVGLNYHAHVEETGRTVTHLVSVSLQGNILTAAVVDVTKRKRIEKELLLKTIHLQETNTAIKVLLQQRQREVDEIRNNFLSNVRHLVQPYLKKLHSTPLSEDQRSVLSVIETNLDLIVSPFVGNLFNAHAGFTPKEVRVATLMRQEMAVKDIAAMMNISASAVNLHRQNIRKKLKLTGKKVNLRTFLQSMTQ